MDDYVRLEPTESVERLKKIHSLWSTASSVRLSWARQTQFDIEMYACALIFYWLHKVVRSLLKVVDLERVSKSLKYLFLFRCFTYTSKKMDQYIDHIIDWPQLTGVLHESSQSFKIIVSEPRKIIIYLIEVQLNVSLSSSLLKISSLHWFMKIFFF